MSRRHRDAQDVTDRPGDQRGIPSGPVGHQAQVSGIAQAGLIESRKRLSRVIEVRHAVFVDQPAQLEEVVHDAQVVRFAVRLEQVSAVPPP